jgi:ribosomal protein S6--L-glutamate ligase
MIVSFHPCIAADVNRLCAGRKPDATDLAVIQSADAVILPQGCRQDLYEMARNGCAHVFPNYDTRFSHPGKMGQIRLFEEQGVCFPQTVLYSDTHEFMTESDNGRILPFNWPFVVKLNWGGEGETVFLTKTPDDWRNLFQAIERYEVSGQNGFMLQQYVPGANKTLRVVVVGQKLISYWRIPSNPDNFYAGIAKGGRIDTTAFPERQHQAQSAVWNLCEKTRIDLAGFDIIFAPDINEPDPLFLEINYFFGRQGLGGSEAYYGLLLEQVKLWIRNMGLTDETVCL